MAENLHDPHSRTPLQIAARMAAQHAPIQDEARFVCSAR